MKNRKNSKPSNQCGSHHSGAAQFLPQLLLTRCITLVHRIRELFAAGDQINVATFLLVAATKLSPE